MAEAVAPAGTVAQAGTAAWAVTEVGVPSETAATGLLDGLEGCDDGGVAPGDGCDAACAIEGGYSCFGAPSECNLVPSVAGDLVITEIMKDPSPLADAAGEWVELHNPTATDLDLFGLSLEDDGVEAHVITAHVIVPAGGYVVLGPNDDAATNGGVTVAYETTGFSLDDVADVVELFNGATSIDRVAYDSGPAFPDPQGATLNLALHALDEVDNDLGASWCPAMFGYGGAGQLGSPGAQNHGCVSFQQDAMPVFQAKCAPCHIDGGGSSGLRLDEYATTQIAAGTCAGLTQGACTIVRIQNGTMPFGAGCSGDPALDAGNAACLTADQQAVIEDWITDGQLP